MTPIRKKEETSMTPIRKKEEGRKLMQ